MHFSFWLDATRGVRKDSLNAGKLNEKKTKQEDKERKVTQETGVTLVSKDEDGQELQQNGSKNEIEDREQKHENGKNEYGSMPKISNLNSNTHASIPTATTVSKRIKR